MRRPPVAARRIWAAARAALALTGIAGLGLTLPALPHLSGSLTSPITVSEVEQVVFCLAWLLALCLALVVLIRAAFSLMHGSSPQALTLLPGVLPSQRSGPSPIANRSATYGRYVLTIPAPTAESRTTPNSPPPPTPQPADTGTPADGDSRTISIAVLGPLAIDGLNRRIKRAATHELLAYLALHPNGASRDELIEAIWPAQDPARTRPRFWQSVTEARKALGDAWLHQSERYQLDPSRVRVDLDDLHRLLTASSDDADAAALETALALWRGEPLEGSDYLWADGEIRSLRATLLDLLERVGRVRLARGDAHGALQMAEQAIALDTLHEPSWRLALQAEHSLGLRESITRRYDELTRSLDEQLGLEPARETRVIYRQLLGQT
jgi:DNA-binding SARP family transcriptional activator